MVFLSSWTSILLTAFLGTVTDFTPYEYGTIQVGSRLVGTHCCQIPWKAKAVEFIAVLYDNPKIIAISMCFCYQAGF